jgi:serine/threonine-protein kinase
MIQPNGNAILIDFGIAKEIIPASSSSTDYAANPSFAPYEQIYKGSKANRQPSVDIYALAASFYYAVTGQKPTPSMERRLDNRPLKSPKEINRNLSEHINTAITLGMSLEKGDRPQSMSDWLQKLELPPPLVEAKYRQEKVNPQPKVTLKSAQNSIQGKPKDIPWGELIGLFLVYGLVGYILGVKSASWLVGAGAGVLTLALAGAMAWAVAAAMAMAWLLGRTHIFDRWKNTASFGTVEFLLLLVFPGLVGGITIGTLSSNARLALTTGIWSIVILFVQVFAACELSHKKFNIFHSFLILAVTNLGGLGSGWLLAFFLHPKG